ncbi:hypothetical protein N7532_004672 [Penicillium argentinense]|uniref:Myb-like DNA-binding domain-containing protein n=1 Tax=Penicillium argentinense TaxID=1131581 RepID=A0A9W9KFV7_9EURO|nr:uncharacterized protein N7532_004672 [Penicillium argentinense]KAJ5104143.1 hypothetical protein N7532_004672 [Penicillium argentinense]
MPVEFSEDRFLAACLKHLDPSCGKVDLAAVAAALDYGNVKSVANRFNSLKKKHRIRVDSFRSSGPSPNKGSTKRRQTSKVAVKSEDQEDDTGTSEEETKPDGSKEDTNPEELLEQILKEEKGV